jgi:hypothetical protein
MIDRRTVAAAARRISMPNYLYPGVYVEEVDAGVTTIGGVSTPGVEPLQRPRYFAGQLLDAATLSAEQDYHREMRRRHNRALLGSGVVSGLGVQIEPAGSGGGRVVVEPGYAIDGLGEEVAVPRGAMLSVPRQGDCAYVTVRFWEHAVSATPTPADRYAAMSMIEEACVVAVSPDAVAPAVALARLRRSATGWEVDPGFVARRIVRQSAS